MTSSSAFSLNSSTIQRPASNTSPATWRLLLCLSWDEWGYLCFQLAIFSDCQQANRDGQIKAAGSATAGVEVEHAFLLM